MNWQPKVGQKVRHRFDGSTGTVEDLGMGRGFVVRWSDGEVCTYESNGALIHHAEPYFTEPLYEDGVISDPWVEIIPIHGRPIRRERGGSL